MRKLIAFLVFGITLGACAQADPDQYKALNAPPVYGESNGVFYDATNDYLSFFVNDAEVAYVDSAGAMSLDASMTVPDLTTTDDVSVGDDLTVTGLATIGETLGVTGDATFGGGAGAITVTAANSSLVCLDNSATGFVMGSSSNANMFQFVTTTGAEKIVIEGTTTAVALHVDLGTLLVDETATITGDLTASAGFTATSPAILHQVIRFCGNGPNAGTETFLSPVPFDDTEADFIDGGAGCDGEDDATIGNADEPWPLLKDAAFKPVAMVCTALCTGASAADDVVVFRLMDDTAAVTGMTCSTSALGGDAVAAQCTLTDTTPATVAAGSLIAIGVDNTDDVCNDAGDDFSCLVYVTF